MVSNTIVIAVFIFQISLQLHPSIAENNWIRVGYYWFSQYQFPVSDINSTFYTHIICAFAGVNSTSYELSLSPGNVTNFSTFTETVKEKNPSVTTLLSIGGSGVSSSTFSSLVSDASYRKSFIDSSIKIARLYGFQGLDLAWQYPANGSEMFNMGLLFEEWRAAIGLEATNSGQSQLILTAVVGYSPLTPSGSYGIEAIKKYLDWVHVVNTEYDTTQSDNFMAAHAALYNPGTFISTDYGLREWMDAGLSANKLVLGLPFYGYGWTLGKPEDNGIGAPATGPARFLSYKDIKNQSKGYGLNVHVIYNATYVVNYCTIGTFWIGFDDVEAIRAKVSYAREKRLLGYHVWQLAYDDNWVLSKAAAEVDMINSSEDEDNKNAQRKKLLLAIVLSTTAAVILPIGMFMIYHCWRTNFKSKRMDMEKRSKYRVNKAVPIDFDSSVPNLIEYALNDIEAATNRFSIENKLGQGGYGPVYKGILPDGKEVAVKKLSKTSTQGFEEFKNEIMLTAKLQHVNLVRVLGYCIDKEEHILIYEYMKNKSLNYYLFDPHRRYILDWKICVQIIEGVIQGILYLQEYSRFTIIHRDLKASNILLDEYMRPKISDFGMARIFLKDDVEANTDTIVGTVGYVPPEYLTRGIYSTKFDVYSFGVLLLEIISGKRVLSFFYLQSGKLNLLECAYELWKDGKGMEFMDPSLDDTFSSYKLMKCLQIALVCVQENRNDRPSMIEVFRMLKNETRDIKIPTKPASWEQNHRNEAIIKLEFCRGTTSNNDVTVSEVVGR